MDNVTAPRALILGCAGTDLSDAERAFFRDADPLGFILFARNCESGSQIRALVADLRTAVGREDAPVLIDQEGGRVARLPAPEWVRPPAQGAIGALDATRGPVAGNRAAWLHGALIGHDLAALGISIDCSPVLDLQFPGQSTVVGDRAFSADPETVTRLGRAVMDGLQAAGVVPAIKHLPGHGRATADSHLSLPVVSAGLEELRATDFVPFRALRDATVGLTAHIRFPAIDDANPATQSATVIRDIIRGEIGFGGLLLSDDLSMAALEGGLDARAEKALAAGCDIALHCNGNREEMERVVSVAPRLGPDALRRWHEVAGKDLGKLESIKDLREEFEVLMESGGGA